MTAKVELPALPNARGVWMGGRKVQAQRDRQWWILKNEVSGTVSIEER
jgi:hypothetical protein